MRRAQGKARKDGVEKSTGKIIAFEVVIEIVPFAQNFRSEY
jgi:hypothetical protein